MVILNCNSCRYSTRVSRGRGTGYFLKQIKIPFGKTLDIIGFDTGAFKVSTGLLNLLNLRFVG